MLYMIFLFIHVLVGVLGLGFACGFPILIRSAQTAAQASHTLQLLDQLQLMPKLASLILLFTGVGMATLEPEMYTKSWFTASLIVYAITQIFVIRLLPGLLKKQAELPGFYSDEELPQTSAVITRKKIKFEGILHLCAVGLLTLMVFQPF
jgi:uncharacterized membrane protein